MSIFSTELQSFYTIFHLKPSQIKLHTFKHFNEIETKQMQIKQKKKIEKQQNKIGKIKFANQRLNINEPKLKLFTKYDQLIEFRRCYICASVLNTVCAPIDLFFFSLDLNLVKQTSMKLTDK